MELCYAELSKDTGKGTKLLIDNGFYDQMVLMDFILVKELEEYRLNAIL